MDITARKLREPRGQNCCQPCVATPTHTAAQFTHTCPLWACMHMYAGTSFLIRRQRTGQCDSCGEETCFITVLQSVVVHTVDHDAKVCWLKLEKNHQSCFIRRACGANSCHVVTRLQSSFVFSNTLVHTDQLVTAMYRAAHVGQPTPRLWPYCGYAAGPH